MESLDDDWDDGRRLWRRLLRRLSALDVAGSPVGALADINALRGLLDRAELVAVRAARRSGSSWAEIAVSLGMTRQSAWERWRELDGPSDDEASEKRGLDEAGAVIGEASGDILRAASSAAVAVPDVVGLTSVEARQLLESSRLVALQHGGSGSLSSGTVTDQTPQAGARRRVGSSVTLWIEDGGGSAGSREPRRPKPPPRAKAAEL